MPFSLKGSRKSNFLAKDTFSKRLPCLLKDISSSKSVRFCAKEKDENIKNDSIVKKWFFIKF
jgi:hypothetical protein